MISIQEVIIRLLLGAVIGGIIGLEREIHGRAAGFRTQLMVCVAAVLIMIISENYYYFLHDSAHKLQIDPARIASGALIGIGFLGGGVIVKSGLTVRGLTTAALIWIVSAIGLAIGGGLYFSAVTASVITIITLVFLRKIEKKISVLSYRTIKISTKIIEGVEESVTNILSDSGITIQSVDYKKDLLKDEFVYIFNIHTRNSHSIREVFIKLGELEFVKTLRIYSKDTLPV